MSTSTKVSPGALRAARIICGKDQHVYLREGEHRGWTGPEALAEIIDDETAASEMLEALQVALEFMFAAFRESPLGVGKVTVMGRTFYENARFIDAAIRKATEGR